MENQKIDNLLNLSMAATKEEREKSAILEEGYDPVSREWDVIIKYSGSLEAVRRLASDVSELLNGYAIVTIKEERIDVMADLPEVEFVEKPKRLYFQVENGKRVSCINEIQNRNFNLSGNGIYVAVIDSGIDYTLPEFRNADGSTRIRFLYDQTLGKEYTMEQINDALSIENEAERRNVLPVTDISGHGTAVAGIAAGRNSMTGFLGVAPESDLIIVKMGTSRAEGFPRTTELMAGVDYVVRKSLEANQPMAINISFGNSYGAHNGQSLLERYIDSVSALGRICVCIGAGNEGRGAGHASGNLSSGETVRIELAVQERETGVNLQLWKSYTDEMTISLITPSGDLIGPIQERVGPQRYQRGQTELLVYYGEPSPYTTSQEIFIDFLPAETYIMSGVWEIVLEAGRVVEGNYDLWLPGTSALNTGTGFLIPSAQTTLTIPSTASGVITAGAYDALTFTYADFSGRGTAEYNNYPGMQKPDLVAPGVNVVTVAAGGGYAAYTGTSFATPFVTGSCALMMEWGIVRGNDPYLYGEKVKAYLRRGSRQLPGFSKYPNNQIGYGALCVKDSLPL